MAKKIAAKTTCRNCGKPSNELGALSGTCPECQDAAVESLEQDLRMTRGSLGRVVKRVKKPCSNCKGEGWFTTNSGTVMCSACRGKGRK